MASHLQFLTNLMIVQGSIVTVSLKGYIFFGSSLRLCDEVRRLGEVTIHIRLPWSIVHVRLLWPFCASDLCHTCHDVRGIQDMAASKGQAAKGMDKAGGYSEKHLKAAADVKDEAPSFLILDFRRVDGFDASSAQVRSRECCWDLRRLRGNLALAFHSCGKASVVCQLHGFRCCACHRPSVDCVESWQPWVSTW